MKTFDAVKALIHREEKYLVLKKSSSIGLIGGDYEIPGGRKQNEDDETALKRETREESGLEISIVKKLNSWRLELNAKDLILRGVTYLCDYVSGEVRLSEEHEDYEWVSRDELLGLSISDWLRESVGCV